MSGFHKQIYIHVFGGKNYLQQLHSHIFYSNKDYFSSSTMQEVYINITATVTFDSKQQMCKIFALDDVWNPTYDVEQSSVLGSEKGASTFVGGSVH